MGVRVVERQAQLKVTAVYDARRRPMSIHWPRDAVDSGPAIRKTQRIRGEVVLSKFRFGFEFASMSVGP